MGGDFNSSTEDGSIGRGGSAGPVHGEAPRDQSVRGGFAGQVRCGGSAGPVLRSQGTLGQGELSRGRATGIRMSTFLRSLRTAPAAASWSGPGSVPPIYTKGDTLYYTDVVAGAPRDRSCARCGLVVAQEGSGEARRRSAPTGHRIPAQGETLGYGTQPERSEGTPHTPGFSRLFCSGRAGAGAGDQCLDGVWRISAGGAPRDMSRCGLVASKGLG